MSGAALKYTHPPIASTPPKTVLPQGTALVLEGGGTRGFFSSGVMDAFIEAGIMFPYILGVSAGAANALSYLSGQFGRTRQVVEHYVADPRYVSPRNLILHGSVFNYKFIFNEISEKHIFLDFDAARRCPTRFLAGCVDAETGKLVYFTLDDVTTDERGTDCTPVIASCSVPMISKIVKFRGHKLVDGGVYGGVPIEKSIADGNTFHVVVLTRNAGFVKEPEGHAGLAKILLHRYPKLRDVLARRHEIYAEQVALCEQLERDGKALILRPQKPIWAGRSEQNTAKLLALYDEGTDEGRAAVRKIESRG
ncbi:MAG: patatin family protein [Oscillospiraceae bacterium]|jgi:predicted patatin/cPLA2 family phospholipase|nr:patatin family protein [Oscillospiraceae bacterium]